MIKRYLTAILIAGALALPAAAEERCVDLKAIETIQFKGTLTHKVFPGPPNFEDVRKGDRPEPTYILKLEKPICVTGDEFIEQGTRIERVQIFPDYANKEDRILTGKLRSLVGKVVVVQGNSPFGAHTGHHHAPLLLPITKIAVASEH